MKTFLLWGILCCSAVCPASTLRLFGVEFNIDANDKAVGQNLEKYVRDKTPYYQKAFDPDCYYKEQGNKWCGKGADLPEAFHKLIDQIGEETERHFTLYVETKKGKKRDYGGLADSAVLEELARRFNQGWVGNFSGDIYIAPKTKLKNIVFLTEPMVMNLPFAAVDMESGWVVSGTSPGWGGKVHKQDQRDFDFDKMVLFAKPEFNGARLDAWKTALIEGGKDLLNHLLSLKEYSGQWAYLYFERGGKIVCSPKIDCDFKDSKKRIVRVDWSK